MLFPALLFRIFFRVVDRKESVRRPALITFFGTEKLKSYILLIASLYYLITCLVAQCTSFWSYLHLFRPMFSSFLRSYYPRYSSKKYTHETMR